MRFSKTTVMALDALAYIGHDGQERPVPLRRIARSLTASPTYLSKVLQQLASAGHIIAVMGPRGGYKMARNPRKISVLEVVENFEKPATVGGKPISSGSLQKARSGTDILGKALLAVRSELSSLTIADLSG